MRSIIPQGHTGSEMIVKLTKRADEIENLTIVKNMRATELVKDASGAVAIQVGVDEVIAGVLPDQKDRLVHDHLVGDGACGPLLVAREHHGAYAQLTQAVGGFEDEGHQLSLYLKDLTTGATISYRADESYYPASSIKGPYVVAVYETLVDTGRTRASSVAGLAESAIVNSDNNAFRSLREAYGASVFGTWLQSFGFDTSGYGGSYSYRVYYYPHTSATQLAQMWEHMYEYLSSGTDSAGYLASLFEQREVSPMADAVGDKYKSWGKAGWYASREGQGTRPTTVDAGIVFADARP